MKYKSTRGHQSGISFEQSLFVGWLEDGSLLVPECIPKLTKEEIQSWSPYSYQEIIIEMFKLFAGDEFLSTEELKSILSTSHASFPEKVTPLKKINDQTFVLELFHGPTHSFKDVSLSTIGPLLNLVLKRLQKHGIVYVCTTGDTGSAVINVTKDSTNIDTITLLPGGLRITELQRLLMTTIDSKNIHNFTGDCSCDEFDIFIQSFPAEVHKKYPDLVVTSLNSLTWVRVMIQVGHLFYAYFQVSKDFQPIEIVIPTGGAGHMTSAIVAKKLGLPIKITCAFNSKNLSLFNFLSGNDMHFNLPVKKSLTPAMDIQIPTNADRLIYLLTDGNVELVKELMQKFYNDGCVKVPDELFGKIKECIRAFVSSDEDIIETMKRCWNENDYIIDPHTAVGFTHFYKREESPSETTVYCATASPIKFTEELELAGIPIPQSYTEYFGKLKSQEEHFRKLPLAKEDWMSFLLKYIDEQIMAPE